MSERVPRNKYNDVAKATLAYAKQRKHTGSATRRLRRRLLKLLAKLRFQWNGLASCTAPASACRQNKKSDCAPCVRYASNSLTCSQARRSEHRIVSIDRPYLRPIVRGKENKRVEFGAKVNNIQIDGISFIEHHSFEASTRAFALGSALNIRNR